MGQAKQRGTFEQRKATALTRRQEWLAARQAQERIRMEEVHAEIARGEPMREHPRHFEQRSRNSLIFATLAASLIRGMR